MENLWNFLNVLAFYVPSALSYQVVIPLLSFSAIIIRKLIADKPNQNVQRPFNMNPVDVNNMQRSEANFSRRARGRKRD